LTAARRLGVGPEIAAARGRTGCGTGIERPGTAKAAAWPWSAEAGPCSGRSRSAEPSGARTGEAAARPRSTRAAILARPRLAHCQRAAIENLPVEPLNRLFRVRAIAELDKGKAARASRFAIDGYHHLCGRRHGAEVAAQVSFGSCVRQIPDEQTDTQSNLSYE